MAIAISSLVPYLRMMADDNDISLQEYTDSELEGYIRLGTIIQEASWNQGYSVVLNESAYEITPNPPDWLQILYVLKTALGMKIFQEKFSYNNKVMSVTRTSKTEDLKGLQFLYDEIIQERKYGTVGYSFTTWDDFFTRPTYILNEITQGYR